MFKWAGFSKLLEMIEHRLHFICLVFWLTILISWKQMDVTYWIISSDSSLEVRGSTNVNKYSCTIPHYDQADTLQVVRSAFGIGLSGSLTLSIENFDCHNLMMTKELQKTLKSKEFPNIYIQFLSLNELPMLSVTPLPVYGLVDIKLAGYLKRYKVNYQISKDLRGVIHLVGTRTVNFSDFALIPPKKLGGLVRSEDELTVVFNLNIRSIN